jgi:hypothetical protein
VTDRLGERETRELRKAFDGILAACPDDAQLLPRLEGMATQPRFALLAWYWAPQLHARSPARFRAFIQQHFADGWTTENKMGWQVFEPLPWKGEVAQALSAWQAELERAGDLTLLRRLTRWRYRKNEGWGFDEKAWASDLVARFEAAGNGTERARLLQQFALPLRLAERDAQRLYAADAAAAAPFILQHLPYRAWGEEKKDARWLHLTQDARARGDTLFAQALYRKLVPVEVWTQDLLATARSTPDPAALNERLRALHPEGLWTDLGGALRQLLELRGEAALPYLRENLSSVHGRGWLRGDSADQLAALAEKKGLTDFRIAVLVQCASGKAWNRALLDTLKDRALPEPERLRRLGLFSGVSREWSYLGWGFAAVQQMDGDTALALYRAQPALLRQQFKAHVTPAWGEPFAKLFDAAWSAGDEDLCDTLAARYLTRGQWGRWGDEGKAADLASEVADRLLALKLDPPAFARRAAAILTRVPAYAIPNYNGLLEHNRLARLLFERALPDFLAAPASLPDLVEGAEIHVQRLAYRVLAQPDARARAAAAANLDVLIGTLLRKLHRETRLHAFRALLNAARESSAAAARILVRAREAYSLPDEGYPKEALLGLIGQLLAAHPTLAAAHEQPRVFRRERAAA